LHTTGRQAPLEVHSLTVSLSREVSRHHSAIHHFTRYGHPQANSRKSLILRAKANRCCVAIVYWVTGEKIRWSPLCWPAPRNRFRYRGQRPLTIALRTAPLPHTWSPSSGLLICGDATHASLHHSASWAGRVLPLFYTPPECMYSASPEDQDRRCRHPHPRLYVVHRLAMMDPGTSRDAGLGKRVSIEAQCHPNLFPADVARARLII